MVLSKTSSHTHRHTCRRLFPLRRQFGMSPRSNCCSLDSILTGCVTAWYAITADQDRNVLRGRVRSASYITGSKLSTIKDFYTGWCQKKTQKTIRLLSPMDVSLVCH
ncbi:hypothetical protein UPYG_G00336400 [Umbra pygmaea]|uniref:Uncharacterized protein n=1 Tax=Umbra pygmaea TaxID=75934 RepID=A0ABD0VXE3_UMBPY